MPETPPIYLIHNGLPQVLDYIAGLHYYFPNSVLLEKGDNLAQAQPGIVFYIHLMPKHDLPRHHLYCLINTEQLTTHYNATRLIDYFRRKDGNALVYCDYGIGNIHHMTHVRRGFPHSRYRLLGTPVYIPCPYNPAEKIPRTTPPQYDVAFIGMEVDRRKSIMDDIRKAGIAVNSIRLWRAARDVELGKCRMLVNVHSSSSMRVFETIRCYRCIFDGMPVISEESIDAQPLSHAAARAMSGCDNDVARAITNDSVIFSSNLITAIREVLGNEAAHIQRLRNLNRAALEQQYRQYYAHVLGQLYVKFDTMCAARASISKQLALKSSDVSTRFAPTATTSSGLSETAPIRARRHMARVHHR